MLTRDQFIELLRMEVGIINHLYTKVNKDQLQFKLSATQRTLSEVLDNLPVNLFLIPDCVFKGNFDNYKTGAEAIALSAQKDFTGTMDAEFAKLETMLKGMKEEEFQTREVVFPNGAKLKAGMGLTASAYRFLIGYKMQLFQYLKASGRTELGSMNLWFGQDPPPKQA